MNSIGGISPAPKESDVPEVSKAEALRFPEGLPIYKVKRTESHFYTWLCRYSPFQADEQERAEALEKVEGKTTFSSVAEERAFGALLGLAVGDALGAPFEFTPFSKEGHQDFTGFDSAGDWEGKKLKLKPGQWTDDTSMALCLADSLLSTNEFDPMDLRWKFACWSTYGYNNSFGFDAENPDGRSSVGLGGLITHALQELSMKKEEAPEFTQMGDWYSSGNGSIMRLAPVPIFYRNNLQEAMEIAYLQSKTTHQGEEAAECCRLLSYIVARALTEELPEGTQAKIDFLLEGFESPLHSVTSLAKAEGENEWYTKVRELNLEDRNWSWKEEDYTFAPSRVEENSKYVGSYVMDCLSMALHCVYTTNSFEEAALKAARQGGDSDTVAAVVGQIAGAIYGFNAIPQEWVQAVLKWDGNKDIPLRAQKLFQANSTQT